MNDRVSSLITAAHEKSAQLTVVAEKDFGQWISKQATAEQRDIILESPLFTGCAGDVLMVARQAGAHAIVVVADAHAPQGYEFIPGKLPRGRYHVAGVSKSVKQDSLALGWALGTYSFDKYKSNKPAPASVLSMPAGADGAAVMRMASAIYNTRDLINTRANDLGPLKMEGTLFRLAKKFNAKASSLTVTDEQHFPLLWHVGKAAMEKPRMMEMNWTSSQKPKMNLTLIGKGVTYDSGGLALKPRESMAYMHADMSGAAHVLGLAEMIMAEDLPINLRVIIPTVENAINERALRNGDIVRSRSGKTVEISNTDAEGRLILADALTLVGEASVKPDLIIDFATLTGAARTVADSGAPVIFCEDYNLARKLEDISVEVDDRVQAIRLDARNAGKVRSFHADFLNSAATLPGHVYAAHFLNAFSPPGVPRIHIDHGAWDGQQAKERALRATHAFVRRQALGL